MILNSLSDNEIRAAAGFGCQVPRPVGALGGAAPKIGGYGTVTRPVGGSRLAASRRLRGVGRRVASMQQGLLAQWSS